MKTPDLTSIEKLYPFVLRARKLAIGRENLFRKKGKLHFILITSDISDNSKREILNGFPEKPVVQYYTAADLEKFFAAYNTKVIGFIKSTLSTSIYAQLQQFKIIKPEGLPPADKEKPAGQ